MNDINDTEKNEVKTTKEEQADLACERDLLHESPLERTIVQENGTSLCISKPIIEDSSAPKEINAADIYGPSKEDDNQNIENHLFSSCNFIGENHSENGQTSYKDSEKIVSQSNVFENNGELSLVVDNIDNLENNSLLGELRTHGGKEVDSTEDKQSDNSVASQCADEHTSVDPDSSKSDEGLHFRESINESSSCEDKTKLCSNDENLDRIREPSECGEEDEALFHENSFNERDYARVEENNASISGMEESYDVSTESEDQDFDGFDSREISSESGQKSVEEEPSSDVTTTLQDEVEQFKLQEDATESKDDGDRSKTDEPEREDIQQEGITIDQHPNSGSDGLNDDDSQQEEDVVVESQESNEPNSDKISENRQDGTIDNSFEKDESSSHGSDGDSSPGRLQIDAEDIQEPVKSEEESDEPQLTMDTEETETEEPVVKNLIEDHSPLSLPCSNLDKTIENVASGNVSPVKLDLKITIPFKRKRTAKKLKRVTTGDRLVQNNGNNVQKWHVSSMLKCPRCPMSSFSAVSALLEHQRSCGSRLLAPTPTASGEQLPKMPRKVYMCSACGSYFENWNLFLHMKEMHNRHMCLHCLGMFSQASKLAQHLVTKHQIRDQAFLSGDELSALHPGPHFLLCVRCDRMCTDKDFESHSCASVCSHCGLAGTHYPTCRLAPQLPPKPTRTPKRRARAPRKLKEPATAPATVPEQQPALPPPETTSVSQDLRSPAEELSPTTFNERMLQLYRSNKPPEKILSSVYSIEETINRVIEENAITDEEDIVETDVAKEPEKELPAPSPEPMEHNNTDDSHVDEKELDIGEDIEEPEATNHESDEDTSDSEKLTISFEPGGISQRERHEEQEGQIVIAGEETPFTSVPLSEPLNVARVPIAMKLFVRSTSLTCVYCAHARKIAVNGKQLALHLLAQHRYITVAESTSLQERTSSHSTVVKCLREALASLDLVYFNAYGYDSSDKSAWRSSDRVYECFHCCYSTPDSKEFLTHLRKIHQNASHLCIMCKTRFLTYSELLCHLCGGVYVPGRIMDPELQFRCYACDCDPLPSSFQLMVHLRRQHTACDMCFALCEGQGALFAHVQKHKFLFYCYACALTYRTRQEMTKHIFWKHGAESVSCKRCLQKKWKHAYHFCLPPPGFTCEECAGWFKTTSALRVHKRLHRNEFPHACTQCDEKFISRKLLTKHLIKHEPPPPANGTTNSGEVKPVVEHRKKAKKKKEVADLFNLPPVNLSESDDSSDEEKPKENVKAEAEDSKPVVDNQLPLNPDVEGEKPAAEGVGKVDGKMWDGVLAGLEGEKGRSYPPDSPFFNLPLHRVSAIMLADHDYCRQVIKTDVSSRAGADHDYCNNGVSNNVVDKLSPRKMSKRRTRSSSSDSSSSSSSSCTCGSNCSCSSSSSSTESADSGEPRPSKRQSSKKGSKSAKNKSTEVGQPKEEVELEPSIDVGEMIILETDLETDEPVTDDDDFYEKNPALRASEVLRRNRSLLLDKLETSQQLPHRFSPSKQKSKSKKHRLPPAELGSPEPQTPLSAELTDYEDGPDTPGGRRPRRKRVPLKYYGFSSGEEDETSSHVAPPRKKERLVEHNTTIPAPAQPPQAPPSPEPSNLWNPPSWRPPPVPPKVNPIKIRTGSLKQTFAKSVDSGEFTITRADLGGFHVNGAASEGNRGEKLYCFCQCPYDEVSEMIACDAVDCRIEWFHFECVGIMVPPKGKWFCPECKKKAAAESEMMGIPLRPA